MQKVAEVHTVTRHLVAITPRCHILSTPSQKPPATFDGCCSYHAFASRLRRHDIGDATVTPYATESIARSFGIILRRAARYRGSRTASF